jgi:hypothetical protein
MKRLVFTFIIILISSNSLYADNFNWKKISIGVENKDIFYLDKKTVFKVGDYVYYWMLVDYFDGSEDKSSITHNMVKCNTFENKYISFTSFTEHKGKGSINTDAIVPEMAPDIFVWNKFPKDSTHGILLVEVCKVK